MTRNKVTLTSKEVQAIKNYEVGGLRMPFFVKKSDDEGSDFYYIGDVKPYDFYQGENIDDENNKRQPIVNILFNLDDPVDDTLLSYFLNSRERECEDK
jgi:hypothetical protein